MKHTTRLVDVAKVIRSKYSNPFTLTLDVFFEDKDAYEKVKKARIITSETIAKLYNVPEEDVDGIYFSDHGKGIKITLRWVPAGDLECSDVHGAQEYIPLTNMELP